MYKLNYKIYSSFLKEMQKYNNKYKHLSNFKELKKEVILALRNNPRYYKPLNAHKLKGILKEFYAISTGLNSNRDRIVYYIDDENKEVLLKTIGDHSIYESVLEYWQENNLI
jgi:mRNA-degrading endonuclease YafQ of YafQ-DinJ toxin-antitoxin module